MSIEAYSLLKNGNLKLSEHFKVREFYCREDSYPLQQACDHHECIPHGKLER